MFNLQIAQWSRTGKLHTRNEDAAGAFRPAQANWLMARGQLSIVADGIGGGAHGRVASRFAINTIRKIYYSDRSPSPVDALQAGIQRANAWLYYWSTQPQYKGMGAAMVAVILCDRELIIAHLGDCRAYLYRAHRLWRLTRDHNWGEEMVAAGILSPHEAARHPYRNVLSRSLGASPMAQIDVARYAVYPNDRVILCSDGVIDAVGEGGLLAAAQTRSVGAAIRRVRNIIGWRKPGDDATALAVDVKACLPPNRDPRIGCVAATSA